MSLDPNLRNYSEAYEDADESFRQVISESFDAVAVVFRSHGWAMNGNDPAYDLETAIVKYAVISLGLDLNQSLIAPEQKRVCKLCHEQPAEANGFCGICAGGEA
jgi:hypothetical protein